MERGALSPADHAALRAQAAAMAFIPAIRHLRARTGCSLAEGKRLAEQIADDAPGSPLALGRAAWEARGRRIQRAMLLLAVGLILAACVIARLAA